MTENPGLLMKYFVLKPRGRDAYAHASRKALLEYSRHIRRCNERLSVELQQWAQDEQKAAQRATRSRHVVQEGERFVLPFWVDNQTWVYSRQRLNNQFYHHLLHVPSDLEATSNVQQSPFQACTHLRETIDKQLKQKERKDDNSQ